MYIAAHFAQMRKLINKYYCSEIRALHQSLVRTLSSVLYFVWSARVGQLYVLVSLPSADNLSLSILQSIILI